MSFSGVNIKPPNVLLYTSGKLEKVAQNIEKTLQRALNTDKYIVYQLTKQEVLGSPWNENTALLVVNSDDFSDEVKENFVQYLKNGGSMLLFCSKFQCPEIGLMCRDDGDKIEITVDFDGSNVSIPRGKYSYALQNSEILIRDDSGREVVKKSSLLKGLIVSELCLACNDCILSETDRDVEKSNGMKRLILLQKLLSEHLGLDVHSHGELSPTSGYIIAENNTQLIALKTKINIKLISLGQYENQENVTSELKVPLLFEDETGDTVTFDKDAYFSVLKSKIFGRTVVYFPVVTSTMIPIESLSEHEGSVVIASHQVKGKGRSSNLWLSPKGSASFTLHVSLSLSSRLGQRLSVLQHMATLAVVHGIRKIPMYSKLQLRLKWPNDLYYETDKKIGGVLVNTTIQGDAVHAYIGIGVNVSNPHPTLCINSAVKARNASGEKLQLLKVEEVIARTLTELESIIDVFENSGPDEFLSLYYSYWLHENQHVTIAALKEEAQVHGLDEYGFLIVETDAGKRITLQPDGNRFDIMKNLIIAKQ